MANYINYVIGRNFVKTISYDNINTDLPFERMYRTATQR